MALPAFAFRLAPSARTIDGVNLSWSSALAQPPSIAEIAVGTYLQGRDTCPMGYWRFQLYVTPGTVQADGVTMPIGYGSIGVFPPQTHLRFSYRDRMIHACSHFRLLAPAAGAHGIDAPIMIQDLGQRFEMVHRGFLEAVRWSANAPSRARARLWDLLWEVAARESTGLPGGHHRAVSAALSYIEQHLGGPLQVDAIAKASGYSQNQLLRFFHREFGHTIVAHVRKRRIDRARHLLVHSQLSVHDVAREVGIEDPQVFNKMFRKEAGCCPRDLRAGLQCDDAMMA